MLVHGDDLGRGLEAEVGMHGEQRFQLCLQPDHNYLAAKLGRRESRSGYDLGGSVVAAHPVNCDADRHQVRRR
jgi:hypothetical protein